MTTDPDVGMIVTFFSWKGGVGRTTALANIAVQLARMGNSVLMVDWDLEAPGLGRFFLGVDARQNARITAKPAHDQTGLMGLLNHAFVSGDTPLTDTDWQDRLINLRIPLPEPSVRGSASAVSGRLDLLPSGDIDPYFSWSIFFGDARRGDWLESLRDQWSAAYDYVLIDSRAGLTDTGGICMVQMPHMLVLVFGTNEQSLDGGLRAVAAAQEERRNFGYDRAPLMVIPLLSRWEGENEVDIAETWMQRLDRQLAPLTAPWLPRAFSPRKFLEKTRVPHVPRFSFGEPLPVLTHSLTDPGLPGLYFDTIARLIHSRLADAGSIIDPRYQDGEVVLGDTELLDMSAWIEGTRKQFAENEIGALIQERDFDRRYDFVDDTQSLQREEAGGFGR
jgi:MinD-like ATPase involved in chromosome partitioning or flagellar assembly